MLGGGSWHSAAPGRGTSGSQAGHTAPDRDPSLDLVGATRLCSCQGPWAARGSYKEHPCLLPPATMRAPLLLLLLALGSGLRSPQPPEARAKLCGHHLVRTLVRVCGGPRWSPEATQPVETRDRELLQWLEQRHLLHALVADADPVLDLQLPRLTSQRQRRSASTNAVHHCCLTGCTQKDLLGLCPH